MTYLNILYPFIILKKYSYHEFLLIKILYFFSIPMMILLLVFWGLYCGYDELMKVFEVLQVSKKDIIIWGKQTFNIVKYYGIVPVICFIFYFITLIHFYFLDYKGGFNNEKYVKYVAKKWRKNINEEKEKKFIYMILKEKCHEHDALLQNFSIITKGVMNQEQEEYIIKVLFDLLKKCQEIRNEVAKDEIVKQLQILYTRNFKIIDTFLQQEKNETYILKNIDKFEVRIYAPNLLHPAYDINKSSVSFYMTYYSIRRNLEPYKKFFSNHNVAILQKLRIIWLIYESDSSSDLLKKIYESSDCEEQILCFIDSLLNIRKEKKTYSILPVVASAFENIPLLEDRND